MNVSKEFEIAQPSCRPPSLHDDLRSSNMADDFIADMIVVVKICPDCHVEEDVDLLSKVNFDAYKFSISWSRVFPNGTGKVNWEGVDYYNSLIDFLLEKGSTAEVWFEPSSLFGSDSEDEFHSGPEDMLSSNASSPSNVKNQVVVVVDDDVSGTVWKNVNREKDESSTALPQIPGTTNQPDDCSFVCVLSACSNLSSPSKNRQLHSLVLKSRIPSNRISVNNGLITMYSKCGKLEDSRLVFDLMPEQNTVS